MLFAAIALTLLAADKLDPGLAVGARPGPYSFLVATGPERGQQTCYVCEQADKPTAIVFARKLTPPAAKLLKSLGTDAKQPGFKAWLTLLTDAADLDALAKWSQEQGLTGTPVGALEDAAGPPSYKLHADAEVTVILFVNKKVAASYAYRAGELTDAEAKRVAEAAGKLGG